MRFAVIALAALALALPALGQAGTGTGGAGLEAHLARATAAVQRYTTKCNVAQPPAKCAQRRAELVSHLSKWEGSLKSRIARLQAGPGEPGPKKTQRIATLQSALTQVAALKAQLT